VSTRREQLEALERIRQLLQAARAVADEANIGEWRDGFLDTMIVRADQDIGRLRESTDPRNRR
jgi:hypothetical protein